MAASAPTPCRCQKRRHHPAPRIAALARPAPRRSRPSGHPACEAPHRRPGPRRENVTRGLDRRQATEPDRVTAEAEPEHGGRRASPARRPASATVFRLRHAPRAPGASTATQGSDGPSVPGSTNHVPERERPHPRPRTQLQQVKPESRARRERRRHRRARPAARTGWRAHRARRAPPAESPES